MMMPSGWSVVRKTDTLCEQIGDDVLAAWLTAVIIEMSRGVQ